MYVRITKSYYEDGELVPPSDRTIKVSAEEGARLIDGRVAVLVRGMPAERAVVEAPPERAVVEPEAEVRSAPEPEPEPEAEPEIEAEPEPEPELEEAPKPKRRGRPRKKKGGG